MQQQLVQMQTHSQSNDKREDASHADEANKDVDQIQFAFLRQVQELLDRIDRVQTGDEKEKKEAVRAIAEALEQLEQGHQQEAIIEEEVCQQMEIPAGSACLEWSESDLDDNLFNASEPKQEKSRSNENSKHVTQDFFIDHINGLTLTRENMEPRRRTVRNNLERRQVDPLAQLDQKYRKINAKAATSLSKERLDEILTRFY